MFVINKDTNTIRKIESKTFHELGFQEREHLQEWIAKNPECLGGEELLIIQKEFDGFNDTNERLDLLALDKSGSLVIIENKLDDSGKDTVWQCLKYVSYCSTLSKQQIAEIYQKYLDKYNPGANAEESLIEFFNDKPYAEIVLNEQDQRMILVAGNFRKEVTSTVMWMLNHKIQVQCFKGTPYQYGKELLLDIEQIIPVKEAEEYIIKMADKAKESQSVKESSKDIENLRKKYWTELLDAFGKVSKQFQNVNPGTDHWLSGGSGVSGIPFSFIATKNYVAIELGISRADQSENKKIFDALYAEKDQIEASFGKSLTWQRLNERKMSRISYRLENADITDLEQWTQIKNFHCEYMPKFYNALKQPLLQAAKKAK